MKKLLKKLTRKIVSLEMRALSLILAMVLLSTCIFTSMSLAGFKMPDFVRGVAAENGLLDNARVRDDALHFLIRHWHTTIDYDTNLNGKDYGDAKNAKGEFLNDVMADSKKNVQTELATGSFFVMIEGYIVPNAEAKTEEENFHIFLVNQTTGELQDAIARNADGSIIPNPDGTPSTPSTYVTTANTKEGTVSITIKPLKDEGDKVEVFSGFSVTTGRSSIVTHTNDDGVVDYLTVHYDKLTYLAKGHVFYTEKRQTVPGTNDPAVFNADETDIDVARIYTYDNLPEDGVYCPNKEHWAYEADGKTLIKDRHFNGEIVKFTTEDPITGEKSDNVCRTDADLSHAQNEAKEPIAGGRRKDDEGHDVLDEKGNPIYDWTNVKLTTYYSTNEGLHTEKVLMQAADGRIFLFDLQTWYTEGYAAQLNFLIDASGSMLFSYDEPAVMNIYGVLAQKLGARKVQTTVSDEEGNSSTYRWTYTVKKQTRADTNEKTISFSTTNPRAANKQKALFELILWDRGLLKDGKEVVTYFTGADGDIDNKLDYSKNGDIDYKGLAEAINTAAGTEIVEMTPEDLVSLFGRVGGVVRMNEIGENEKLYAYPQRKALIGYYDIAQNTDGNFRTWYYNSILGNTDAEGKRVFKPGEKTSAFYSTGEGSKVDNFAKLVSQGGRSGSFNFANGQQTLRQYSDYSGAGSWGGVPAKFGDASGFSLGGATKSGFLLNANSTPKSGESFTISFWAGTEVGTKASTDVDILYVGPLTGSYDSAEFRVHRSGNALEIYCGGDRKASVNGVFANTKQLLTFTYDAQNGDVRFYWNGAEAAKVSGVALTASNIVFAPFADQHDASTEDTKYFIDEIMVYATALTLEEVEQLFSVRNDTTIKGNVDTYESAKNAAWEEQVFLYENMRDLLLNPRHTDSRSIGTNGYSYYVFSTANNAYIPLGYWEGTKRITNVSWNGTSLTIAQTSEGVRLGALDPGGGLGGNVNPGAGWYFVTHQGRVDFYKTVGTGKRLQALTKDYTLTDESIVDGKKLTTTYKTTGDVPSKFYIDGEGNLRCFNFGNCTSATSAEKTGTFSYVYELEDTQYSRVEAAQRILANFSTRFSALSPTSYISAVRYSSETYDTAELRQEQILLDWSTDPTEAAAIMSNTRGHEATETEESTIGKVDGWTMSPYGTKQYNYVLTGSTTTRYGLWSYVENLHGVEKCSNQTNNNHGAHEYKIGDTWYEFTGSKLKDKDAPKFIVIFTDGADTDYTKANGNVNDAKVQEMIALAGALKGEGYTIAGVLFAGGTLSKTEADNARDFFSLLVGTSKDGDMDAATKLARYSFDATKLAKLVELFDTQIMAQMIDSLTGYTIQEYIDPRFDLQQGDGTLWELGANGEITVEGVIKEEVDEQNNTKIVSSISNIVTRLRSAGYTEVGANAKLKAKQFKYLVRPSNVDSADLSKRVAGSIAISAVGGAPFHIFDVALKDLDGNHTYPELEEELADTKQQLSDISTGARNPYLYYDTLKDLYYLQWKDQTLPTSQVGSIDLMPVWSVTVMLSAKDDFIGGNAILTSGNDAFMNWVYHPLDLDIGLDRYEDENFEEYLTAQQARNLAEQEEYLEMRIEQYTESYKNLEKANSIPEIEVGDYVEIHLAAYWWDTRMDRLPAYYSKYTESARLTLAREYGVSAGPDGLEAALGAWKLNEIESTITRSLKAKYKAMASVENHKPAISRDDYIAREQAQHFFDHLVEYLAEDLSKLDMNEIKAFAKQYLAAEVVDAWQNLTVAEIAQRILPGISADLDKLLRTQFADEDHANGGVLLEASLEEYIILKLNENKGKKTDRDASSSLSDMWKVYYPETKRYSEKTDAGEIGQTISDEYGEYYIDNTDDHNRIFFTHNDDGTITVYQVATNADGKPIDIDNGNQVIEPAKLNQYIKDHKDDDRLVKVLTRKNYDRDWGRVIDGRVSKGIPRATVNVQLLEVNVGAMYQVVYMGEVVSPAQLLAAIEGDIITDSYYLDYLKRYAYQRYLHMLYGTNESSTDHGTIDPNEAIEVNMPLLTLLNDWLQFNNEEDFEKSFSIPYMYLPSVAYGADGYIITDSNNQAILQNNSGFSTPFVTKMGYPDKENYKNKDDSVKLRNMAFDEHNGILADVVGILTYRWELIEPDPHETGDPMASVANFVQDDTERLRYAVTIGFTPLREGDTLEGYWIDKEGVKHDKDLSDGQDGWTYVPGLNDYDDDGQDIFAGYLPIRSEDKAEKWDWGKDKNKYNGRYADFMFDREKRVNGYISYDAVSEKEVPHGYIREREIVTTVNEAGEEVETVKTVFAWNPAYKPAVYKQQLINTKDAILEYTDTDDTVQLINEGQRFLKNENGELQSDGKGGYLTDNDNVTIDREYKGDPRTLKGYSVYALNVVSGGMVLELQMQTGELKQLFNENWVEKKAADKPQGIMLLAAGDEAENVDPVVLDLIFTLKAKRTFSDTDFAEGLKENENLSDYGDEFIITLEVKYTRSEAEEVIDKAVTENYGFASVFARAIKVEGTWYERNTDPGKLSKNAKPVVDKDGNVAYYETETKKVIYEQLPIGTYEFELDKAFLNEVDENGDLVLDEKGEPVLKDARFINDIHFSVLSAERQRDVSKYKDAYEYFDDVVLNGLHTYSEKTATGEFDENGNPIYVADPKLAQRRYDDGGKLVYITNPAANPISTNAEGKGYMPVKDSEGNVVKWVDDNSKADDEQVLHYWYDKDSMTWYEGGTGDPDQDKVFYYHKDDIVDGNPLTWYIKNKDNQEELAYQYSERLQVWRDADGYRVPYNWKEAQKREISLNDEVDTDPVNETKFISKGISNYIADSKAVNGKEVTFYVGTGTDANAHKNPENDSYYPQDRVAIVVLSTGTVKLTIHEESGNENESFMYRVHGTTLGEIYVDFTVSVRGGSYTTIDIAAGEYTVEEIPNWQWRYEKCEVKRHLVHAANGDASIEGVGWYDVGKECYGDLKEFEDPEHPFKGHDKAHGGISAKLKITTTSGLLDGEGKPVESSADVHAEIWFSHERNQKTWVGGENFSYKFPTTEDLKKHDCGYAGS